MLCINLAASNITTYMKFITRFFLFIFIINTAKAQDSTLVISDPIDITQDGWHKLLQMTNGNTMLFHFENRKILRIRVFNKSGKEIAAGKQDFKVFDVNALDKSHFDGLFELDGKAVLFMTQQIDNTETLMRFEFDGNTGRILSEEKAVKSASFKNATSAHVLKMHGVLGYTIVCYNNVVGNDSAVVEVKYYNEKHEETNTIRHAIATKNYDYISFLGAKITEDGSVFATLKTQKIIQHKHLYDAAMVVVYIPFGWKTATVKSIGLPPGLNVTGVGFTKNSFANNINILLHSKKTLQGNIGLENKRVTIRETEMVIMSDDFSSAKEIFLNNNKAKEYIKKETGDSGTVHLKSPVMLNFYTNSVGVSTSIYRESGYEKNYKQFPTIFFGKYLITKYDDNGNEMSATVIPNAHNYVMNETFPSVFRGEVTQTSLYDDVTIMNKNSVYIILNDVERNFNKGIKDVLSQVYHYDSTNTVIYHVNKKNMISKKYFFNNAAPNEYKHVFPGSQDYNELNKRLAIMMRKKAGKTESLHIAWRKMED